MPDWRTSPIVNDPPPNLAHSVVDPHRNPVFVSLHRFIMDEASDSAVRMVTPPLEADRPTLAIAKELFAGTVGGTAQVCTPHIRFYVF